MRNKLKPAAKKAKQDPISAVIPFVNVQVVSEDVNGKWQKFSREGPLRYVPIDLSRDELTVGILKEKISSHLKMPGQIDLLASDRGPSVENVTQLPDMKIIHVRFMTERCRSQVPVKAYMKTITKPTHFSTSTKPTHFSTSKNPLSCNIAKSTSNLKRKITQKSVPTTSLTPSRLVGLGKEIAIPQSSEVPIRVTDFCYDKREWSRGSIKGVEIGEVLGVGGFRTAKMGVIGSDVRVVKFYNDSSKEILLDVGVTEDVHARKSIQMQSAAAYISVKFNKLLKEAGLTEFFSVIGSKLGHVLGGPDSGKVVTIEEMVEGEFVKYVNNDGTIFQEARTLQYQLLAEALVHFSYEHSDS